MYSVEVEKDVDKQEKQEGDGVEDQDVGDVGDVGVGEEFHLFFRGAHEEEAGGVEELCICGSMFDSRGGCSAGDLRRGADIESYSVRRRDRGCL